MTRRLSFHVAPTCQPLHRVPCVPRDDLAPIRGIALGVALSVPVWWALACLASWAHGVMGGRS